MWHDLGTKGCLDDSAELDGEIYLADMGLLYAVFGGVKPQRVTNALQGASLSASASPILRIRLENGQGRDIRFGGTVND